MKKFYSFLAFVAVAAASVSAQTSRDYYIDFNQSQEKYYFDYVDGVYVAKVSQISSDFKIYSSEYVPGSPGQDKYIFGSDGHGGISPDTEKKLSHPGGNLSIEGGGTLYDVTLIFDPANMTLKIDGGSYTPVRPNLSIKVISATGTSFESGELEYEIELAGAASDVAPTSYDVTASYVNNEGDAVKTDMSVPASNPAGKFTFHDLKPGQANAVTLEAVAVAASGDLKASATATITTPVIPILIGQISGHEWQPDYGIHGIMFRAIADGSTYYYEVNLTGKGEFSFVTKLGNNASDWTTVDHNIRYAPSSARVAAPEKTWMPYQIFSSGTSNAWYPENFTPGTYIVEFDYATKSIAVVKGDIPTGVDVSIADEAPSVVDVYSLSGVMLRHSVPAGDAVAGLPRGLYIVGGKKIAVR